MSNIEDLDEKRRKNYLKGEPLYSKGRIVDIRKVDQQYGCILQGKAARHCHDGFGYSGGNGTFLAWDGSGVNHYLFLDVSVYEDNKHKSSIDIRDRALKANGRSRVTEAFVDALKEKNVGKKIRLVSSAKTGWQWTVIDWNELDLTI